MKQIQYKNFYARTIFRYCPPEEKFRIGKVVYYNPKTERSYILQISLWNRIFSFDHSWGTSQITIMGLRLHYRISAGKQFC